MTKATILDAGSAPTEKAREAQLQEQLEAAEAAEEERREALNDLPAKDLARRIRGHYN